MKNSESRKVLYNVLGIILVLGIGVFSVTAIINAIQALNDFPYTEIEIPTEDVSTEIEISTEDVNAEIDSPTEAANVEIDSPVEAASINNTQAERGEIVYPDPNVVERENIHHIEISHVTSYFFPWIERDEQRGLNVFLNITHEQYESYGAEYGFENPLVLGGVVTISKYSDAELVWHSSNEDVIYINERGSLRAAGVGTATITAEYKGYTAQKEITVEEGYVERIEFFPDELAIIRPGTKEGRNVSHTAPILINAYLNTGWDIEIVDSPYLNLWIENLEFAENEVRAMSEQIVWAEFMETEEYEPLAVSSSVISDIVPILYGDTNIAIIPNDYSMIDEDEEIDENIWRSPYNYAESIANILDALGQGESIINATFVVPTEDSEVSAFFTETPLGTLPVKVLNADDMIGIEVRPGGGPLNGFVDIYALFENGVEVILGEGTRGASRTIEETNSGNVGEVLITATFGGFTHSIVEWR